MNASGHRPLSVVLILVALTPACARVSAIERFGGATVALHVENLPPGIRMDAVESTLKAVLAHRSVGAELTPLDRGSGFLVQFPQNPNGPDEIKGLVALQERRSKIFELRLAYLERTRRDLLPAAIGTPTGQSTPIFVEPTVLVDGSALTSVTSGPDRFVLHFDTRAQSTFSDARQRNPSALLAVVVNCQFAGAVQQTDVSQGALNLAANDPRWQVELDILAGSVVPGLLRIGEVRELIAPELDGRGSKYPW